MWPHRPFPLLAEQLHDQATGWQLRRSFWRWSRRRRRAAAGDDDRRRAELARAAQFGRREVEAHGRAVVQRRSGSRIGATRAASSRPRPSTSSTIRKLAWVKLRVIQGAGSQAGREGRADSAREAQQGVPVAGAADRDAFGKGRRGHRRGKEKDDGRERRRRGRRDGGRDGRRGDVDGGWRRWMRKTAPRRGRSRARSPESRRRCGERRRRRRLPSQEAAPVTNNGPPLPALLPKPPAAVHRRRRLATCRQRRTRAGSGTGRCRRGEHRRRCQRRAWRTNYEAFRANITLPRSQLGLDDRLGSDAASCSTRTKR